MFLYDLEDYLFIVKPSISKKTESMKAGDLLLNWRLMIVVSMLEARSLDKLELKKIEYEEGNFCIDRICRGIRNY